MAKTLNKPFYVVAESFKFVRMFPLNQDDLPNAEKVVHFYIISYKYMYMCGPFEWYFCGSCVSKIHIALHCLAMKM